VVISDFLNTNLSVGGGGGGGTSFTTIGQEGTGGFGGGGNGSLATPAGGTATSGTGATGGGGGGGGLNKTGAMGGSGLIHIRYTVPIVSTVTIQATATSTASTITIPATAAVGDVAILFDTSTTTTNVVPSGWTSINGTTTTGIRTNVTYKILVSGDPGNSITGMAGTTRKVMLVYRGNVSINALGVTVPASQSTVSVPTNQTLVGDVGPVAQIAVYGSTGAIATRGWSVGSPTEYSSFSTSGIYVKALITNSGTPDTTTISMSDGGTNTLQSIRIIFL
jgi:hypothetical protein